jgi:hypothetical protein
MAPLLLVLRVPEKLLSRWTKFPVQDQGLAAAWSGNTPDKQKPALRRANVLIFRRFFWLRGHATIKNVP